MPGPNQHVIPRFLQRGFGIPASGKPKEIWVYTRKPGPERKRIKKAAAEEHFYSEPSIDGSKTLDEDITDIESPLADRVAEFRAADIGAKVQSTVACEVVLHLASRSGHVRALFSHGVKGFLERTASVFGNTKNIKQFLGLDAAQPSEFLRERLNEAVREHRHTIQKIGLPEPVMEKIAFQIAKEHFEETAATALPPFIEALSAFASKSNVTARDAHNRALADVLGKQVWRDDLLALLWTVEAGPPEGALLPDCVALAWRADGRLQPFLGVSADELAGVAMPISTSRVLVGRSAESPPLDLSTFNRDAARCCQAFFLAGSVNSSFAVLADSIGERAMNAIDEALDGALADFVAPTGAPAAALPQEESAEADSEPTKRHASSYEVSFLGCADEEKAKRIAATLNFLTSQCARFMSLNRLDGMTFAADYAEALRTLDRGSPDLRPASTRVSPEVGVGIGQSVLVLRNGIIKSRLVFADWVGDALDDEQSEWSGLALHTIVRLLALAAMSEKVDTEFPGVLLKPIGDPYDGMLYGCAGSIVDGYAASWLSAAFGTEETIALDRQLLATALARANDLIPAARLDYRYHGNLDEFLGTTFPVVRDVLQFAANLLGHSHGLQTPALDDELSEALTNAGLRRWMDFYGADLSSFWERRSEWKSFDEFLQFNAHAERVLWQYGVFPWRTEEGVARVEVPLITDLRRLTFKHGASVFLSRLKRSWRRTVAWLAGRMSPRS